ncbi:carbohydrate ABC transporter permease [Serratia oryzae]|uniref:Sugar ABC transporter permease n=1 Tax=Serratia oryzae TaxID=2034155 RepID=A0A1S8CKV0_9GAMM|nr:carbohydrate ABC transporter permease [Serratia oryzae]OMQ23833.1 sugar ABC transporter permease [Serratia oryzae]VXD08885.1 Sugar ABC transporter permease [Enterobacterales bacterium 8AC]
MNIKLSSLLAVILTLLLCFLWSSPLLWAFSTALRSEAQTVSGLQWLPDPSTVEAFVNVLTFGSLPTFFINSVVTSLAITGVTLLITVLAAYSFSQLRFRGANLLFWSCMFGIIFPFEALVIPLFRQIYHMGLVDSLGGIILPQIVSPMVLFVFKRFFDQVPKDFREAAILDGASEIQVLLKVYIPLSKNIIYAMAIITFIGAWNNFLWPFLVISSTENMTIPIGLTQLNDSYGVRYAQNMASALIGGMPVAIIYVIFQKRVASGFLAATGLKG